jgi:hypothetical protein
VGTKNDLVPNNPRAISQDQIDMFKDEFNIDYEFKTSALDSDGVADLFNQICKSLIELENERENQ